MISSRNSPVLISAGLLISVAASADALGPPDSNASTATARIGARIIVPLAVSGDDAEPVIFDVAGEAGASGGPLGNVVVSGDLLYLPKLQWQQLLTLSLSAEASSWYAVTLPRDTSLQVSNGQQRLSVDTLLTTETPSGYLDQQGHETVSVHGRLSPLASQAKGLYTGSFEVIFERN